MTSSSKSFSLDRLLACRLGPIGLEKTSLPILTSGFGPDFVSPAPYLVCKPQDSPNGSGILVLPVLIDAQFRKAWMPYFRQEGHPVVSPQAFLDFVGDHLLQVAFLDLPILTGEELHDAMAKKSTAGGLDGWAWNEIKALIFLGLWDWLWFYVKLNPLVSGLRDS